MSDIQSELHQLLETLEPAVTPADGDAIDRALDRPPRTTRARPLRDDEVVHRFRREVSDGLLRVDTVRQLLALIRLALEGTGR